MIVLNKHNVLLVSLNSDYLEIVRRWRNSDSISKFMEYREEISQQQQKQWFAKINPEKEYYFIIKKDLIPIGMIHINKINSKLKTAEVGLFIGEDNYQGTGIAFGASLNLLDFAFDQLKLKKVFAKVKITNNNAVMYNSFLGFTEEYHLNPNFSMWKLTKETYKENKAKIEDYLS